MSSLSLPEVHGALSLFAEAIVGEPVSVEVAENAWPATPVANAVARIALPAEIDDLAPAAARRWFRAAALQQLVALEDRGDAAPVDLLALRRIHALLPETFVWLEDARIGALARRRYPGGRADLDALTLAGAAMSGSALGAAAEHALIRALRVRCLDGAMTAVASAALGAKLIAAIDDAIALVRQPGSDRETSLAAAAELLRSVAGLRVRIDEIADVDGDGPEVDDRRGAAMDSAATPDEFEDREGTSGGRPVDQDMTAERSTPDDDGDDDGEDEPLSGLMLPVGSRRASPDVRTYVYDEWDFRARSHRIAWCRVLEERLHGDDPSFIGDVRDRHRSLRAEIRRRFGRLRPEQLVRIPRSLDGEDLDLDAAIESIVDRRSGAPADERHHVRRDRAARDVATVFLVDLSASTSSPVAEPEKVPPPGIDPEDDPISYAPIWDPNLPPPEPPRRVIDVAKDAVALMSDALAELGDRHAIYGFSGSGRENVQVQVVKELADPVSPTTWSALDAMRPMRYTRMGPAIRHATSKLVGDAARTRLLVVISDGYPQDVDYGEDARDRAYGMNDTARALADAEAAGIDTFCLTIDPAGHDYLREMAPEQRYLVIDDVEALPAELAKVYLALAS
ncbi:MAG: VWA domain-containing protein [Actinomycetota bacterium]